MSHGAGTLTLALGNRSMRCSTSCIHAVVSLRERERIFYIAFHLPLPQGEGRGEGVPQ
jgi:hypothetical protein